MLEVLVPALETADSNLTPAAFDQALLYLVFCLYVDKAQLRFQPHPPRVICCEGTRPREKYLIGVSCQCLEIAPLRQAHRTTRASARRWSSCSMLRTASPSQVCLTTRMSPRKLQRPSVIHLRAALNSLSALLLRTKIENV